MTQLMLQRIVFYIQTYQADIVDFTITYGPLSNELHTRKIVRKPPNVDGNNRLKCCTRVGTLVGKLGRRTVNQSIVTIGCDYQLWILVGVLKYVIESNYSPPLTYHHKNQSHSLLIHTTAYAVNRMSINIPFSFWFETSTTNIYLPVSTSFYILRNSLRSSQKKILRHKMFVHPTTQKSNTNNNCVRRAIHHKHVGK